MIIPIQISGSTTVIVDAGRVVTFQPVHLSKTVSSITIDSQPDFGVVGSYGTTIAAVFSGETSETQTSFVATINYSDASSDQWTVILKFRPLAQLAGWGTGKHYMLELSSGSLVIETGSSHRKLYISDAANPGSWTRAEIEAAEALGGGGATNAWIAAQSTYGSATHPLNAADCGWNFWQSIGGNFSTTSNHLYLDKGGTYDSGGTQVLIGRGQSGEGVLEPLYIGSFGTGDKPVITNFQQTFQNQTRCVVYDGIEFTGGVEYTGPTAPNQHSYILFNDCDFFGRECGLNRTDYATFRNCKVANATEDAPGGGTWGPEGFVQGLSNTTSLSTLVLNTVIDHNAWEEGYASDAATTSGRPPDGFSHNLYFQPGCLDVTFKNVISARGSSFGLQVRGGAVFDQVVTTKNNVEGNFNDNQVQDGNYGNFTSFIDCVTTDPADKAGASHVAILGRAVGWDTWGYLATVWRTITAHRTDPNNPEIGKTAAAAWKQDGATLDESDNRFFRRDKYQYGWGTDDTLPAGADPDNTTLQLFDAASGSGTGTIDALMNYIIAQAIGTVDAKDIVDYFQAGFGLSAIPSGSTSHSFQPSPLTSGRRWDQRLNWSTEEVPTTGDSVDIADWAVDACFYEDSPSHALTMNGATLTIYGGKLTTSTLDGSGSIVLEGSGQLDVTSYIGSGSISVTVNSGKAVYNATTYTAGQSFTIS